MRLLFVTTLLAIAAVSAPTLAQPVRQGVAGIPETGVALTEEASSIAFTAAGADRVVVADQVLRAVIANAGMDTVIRVQSDRFRTGANRIGDDAFAVFSGILTQSWNSGINANSQAATNVAWGSAGEGIVRFAAAAGDRDGR